jgi:hypothetical protein
MRVYCVPAKYQRFIEAQLTLACAEVSRDEKRRAEGNQIGRRATIHQRFIDENATGELVMLVGVCTHDEARQVERVSELAPRRALEPV